MSSPSEPTTTAASIPYEGTDCTPEEAVEAVKAVRATAATGDLVVINRDERGIVHGCPPDGSGLTPCCQRTPFELPRYDRLTIDPKQVTCGE